MTDMPKAPVVGAGYAQNIRNSYEDTSSPLPGTMASIPEKHFTEAKPLKYAPALGRADKHSSNLPSPGYSHND